MKVYIFFLFISSKIIPVFFVIIFSFITNNEKVLADHDADKILNTTMKVLKTHHTKILKNLSEVHDFHNSSNVTETIITNETNLDYDFNDKDDLETSDILIKFAKFKAGIFGAICVIFLVTITIIINILSSIF